MACDRLRVIEYRKLLEPEKFFPFGRPEVEPPGLTTIFRRPLDRLLLGLIAVSFLGLLIHLGLSTSNLPAFPLPSPNASHDCATLIGQWNNDQSVLRFHGIPYAIPPLAKPDSQTIDVLTEYLELEGKDNSLRWRRPREIEGIEACILGHHDRCSFQKGRWTCRLGKPRPFGNCYQPVYEKRDDLTNSFRLFQQEKCLNLDIFAPLHAGHLQPVVVIIAGFQFNTEPLMPPKYMAPAYWPTDSAVQQIGAVFVYLHYRLGLAGFFYDLNKASRNTTSDYTLDFENIALHDQILALRWIKRFIGRFGGDADRITVLGSASGATSGLALMYMQGTNQTEQLFQQAWLASGAVDWFGGSRDNGGTKNLASEAFQQLVKRYAGAHCVTGTPGTIVNTCPLKELKKKLLNVPIAVLSSLLPNLLSAENSIGRFVGQNGPIGGQSWINGETRFGKLPPPRLWTAEDVEQIALPGGRGSPLRVVFSSMSNELEGWPGMAESWLHQDASNQDEQLAQILYNLRPPGASADITPQSIKVLLDSAFKDEVARTGREGSSRVRSRQEINLELLSILRFACPQSWILEKKLTKSSGSARYYKILSTEPPAVVTPFTPGPNPERMSGVASKRFAFHGLDMMILTGKNFNLKSGREASLRQRKFGAYVTTLVKMFRAFVHGDDIDSTCKTDSDNPHGCILDGSGVKRLSERQTLLKLCQTVDWENRISEIIVPN